MSTRCFSITSTVACNLRTTSAAVPSDSSAQVRECDERLREALRLALSPRSSADGEAPAGGVAPAKAPNGERHPGASVEAPDMKAIVGPAMVGPRVAMKCHDLERLEGYACGFASPASAVTNLITPS